jgi:type I restriction-modification system DNA methylase subunit
VKAVFDFAHDHLFGFDDSEQMAAVARINMLVNEDGRAHVFKHNSLYPRADAPYVTQQKYFDFIFTNPPFGKRISKPSSLLIVPYYTQQERADQGWRIYYRGTLPRTQSGMAASKRPDVYRPA